MRLKFEPEPDEIIKNRWLHVFDHVWTVRELSRTPKKDLPCFNRNNVFDWNDGVRMVVCCERCNEGKQVSQLGISFSKCPKYAKPNCLLCDMVTEKMAYLGVSDPKHQPDDDASKIHFAAKVAGSLNACLQHELSHIRNAAKTKRTCQPAV